MLLVFEADDKKFVETVKKIFEKSNELNQLTIDFLLAMEQNSILITKFQLTNELSTQRAKLRNEFIFKRDSIEGKVIILPSLLMKIIREKYLNLFNNQNNTYA